MNYIECPECGNHVPINSKFCNNCGAKIEQQSSDTCPHCHNSIPAGSTFCPSCGNRVDEPQVISSRVEKPKPVFTEPEDEYATQPTPKSEQPKPKAAPAQKNAWEDSPVRKAAAKAAAPVKPSKPDLKDDDFEDSPLHNPDDEPQQSSKTVYVIIGIVLALFLTIYALRKCFSSESKHDKELASTTEVTQNDNAQSAEIFLKTLQDNNLLADRATVAYAMRFPGKDTGKKDIIVGVTYLSNDTHPFYKIYELEQNGESWTIDLKVTQYLDGKVIKFQQENLKANEDAIPMGPEIDGKKYFFFAYLLTPPGSSGSGQVDLCLYDLEQHKVSNKISYAGSFTNKDGEQVIVGSRHSNGSPAQNWLEDQADSSIGIIHIKTQEEEDKEKEDEKKDEDENKDDPVNDADKWNEENAGKVGEAIDGNEVEMNKVERDKDKPMFNAKDIDKKIVGGSYTIFLTKDGKVFAYNKSTGKNALLYAGASKATNIGWQDSAKGILNIRTANGLMQYDVATGKAKMKKEEKKEE